MFCPPACSLSFSLCVPCRHLQSLHLPILSLSFSLPSRCSRCLSSWLFSAVALLLRGVAFAALLSVLAFFLTLVCAHHVSLSSFASTPTVFLLSTYIEHRLRKQKIFNKSRN